VAILLPAAQGLGTPCVASSSAVVIVVVDVVVACCMLCVACCVLCVGVGGGVTGPKCSNRVENG